MTKIGEVAQLFPGADHAAHVEYLRPPKLYLPVDPFPLTKPKGLPAQPAGTVDHTDSSASNESSLKMMLERYHSAFNDIENPKPKCWPDPWNYEHNDFDFNHKLLRRWIDDGIPAWPVGMDPFVDEWEDVYQESESGPSVMAFICSEGVIVAVDCSVSGGASSPSCGIKLIRFNSRVIGCIAGEAAACELFCRRLTPQDEGKSPEDVSNWLVEIQSSCNLEGLSGIVIAGWDDKGPRLYRLDDKGKLHQGVVFACGSCSEYGYGLLGLTTFRFMSITQAAKLARIALPTAVVDSKFYNGCDDSGYYEASESDTIGGSVVVYCVGPDGIREVDDTGAIKEARPE